MTRTLTLVLTLALVLPLGFATPAAAEHPCLDAFCMPHKDPPHPKEIIKLVHERAKCLLVAQPPTACL